jgi:hypothetical protein
MNKKSWPGRLKGRENTEDLGIYGRIILKWTLQKQGGTVLIGFICLVIGTSGWFL